MSLKRQYRIISKARPERYFIAGQAILGLCLLIAIILIPHYFFSVDQGGLSNYGAEPQTRPLFIIGFTAAALGTLLTSISLPVNIKHRTPLRVVLYTFAVLYTLTMLSTFSYKLNDSLRLLHEHISLVLAWAMLFAVIWLRFWLAKDRPMRCAFLTFSIGFGVGVLDLLNVVHLLFAVELTCGVSFAFMVTHGIRVLVGHDKNA